MGIIFITIKKEITSIRGVKRKDPVYTFTKINKIIWWKYLGAWNNFKSFFELFSDKRDSMFRLKQDVPICTLWKSIYSLRPISNGSSAQKMSQATHDCQREQSVSKHLCRSFESYILHEAWSSENQDQLVVEWFLWWGVYNL